MIYKWKKGISLSYFRNQNNESTGAEEKTLREIQRRGFQCVELSFSREEYFCQYHFTDGDHAGELYNYCKGLGLELWSIHLPFSEKQDLSAENAEEAFRDYMVLLRAASSAHISVAVLHPSFEPVLPEERERRIANAKKNIRRLRQEAEKLGIILALENLPRTCLGNTSKEMLELLRETGTAFVFDTNHSLQEDNLAFLQKMTEKGYCPVSLHISDYDFKDEQHELPGYGCNRWRKLLDLLKKSGYHGPALYEPARHHMSGERIDMDEICDNIEKLLQGKIPGNRSTVV